MAGQHTDIKNRILLELGREPGVMLWNNETGKALSPDGRRWISYGCPGSPDTLGVGQLIIPEYMVGRPLGVALGIEVKTENDRQKPQQQNFERAYSKVGGQYLVARSPDEAREKVKGVLG